MSDTNHVVIVGRLTRDAEVKSVGDTQVGTFSIASNYWAGKDKEPGVSFFDVELWNCRIGQYLIKGKQVVVSGELRQERWQDQAGQSRSRVKIRAQSVQLLGSAGQGGGGVSDQSADNSDSQNSEIPF